jgi:ADP-ribosylglycohydrolase
MKQLLDRIKGAIYGQAIGDALGLGTEFMDDYDMAWKYPNGLTHYSEIYQDRHRRRWEIGDWTDDTDMMLCIANAIIKDNGVNLTTIAQNFKNWANGVPMGIGANTYKVLMFGDYVEHPLDVSRKVWEMSRYHSAANGGLMRTSIVGLLPTDVEHSAADICRLTHYDPRCVGSCVIVSELIHAHVYGLPVPTYEQIIATSRKYDDRIAEFITLSQNQDIKALGLQEEGSIGYTLKTLAAGLWAYWHADTFQDGLLAVVRAGGDADTNAAVACSILGAKFGFNAIPSEYVDGLIYRDQLEEVIQGMMEVIKY